MNKSHDYRDSALFEHRFWLQIMGDHARFIMNALAPSESEAIRQAALFRDSFDRQLENVRSMPGDSELSEVNRLAYQQTGEFRTFKLQLLQRHLTSHIGYGHPPSFVNHMLNELEEYMRVLNALLAGQPAPLFHPVHHHLLWLLDGYGHAATIAAAMDFVETAEIAAGRHFAEKFSHLYLKAVEMAGYLRTQVDRFPALSRFNKQAELEILLFQKFLIELEEMDMTSELLGSLTPLMADHMYREECYYLTKLSDVSEVVRPDCDPGKPRCHLE